MNTESFSEVAGTVRNSVDADADGQIQHVERQPTLLRHNGSGSVGSEVGSLKEFAKNLTRIFFIETACISGS